MNSVGPVTAVSSATSPGKVILFGEHAINRGQPAIAVAVGMYARCRVTGSDCFRFRGGSRSESATRDQVLEFGERVDDARRRDDYETIRRLAREYYFGPQQYVLFSAFGSHLPAGLAFEWESELPSGSGLGSGGAAFTSMVTAIAPWLPYPPTLTQRAEWAQRGDIVAHGGVASGLDTQTSLLGGAILYTGTGLAERIECAPGLTLVIAHTGMAAATGEVNSRVRSWLAERPKARLPYFATVGALSRMAVSLLARGDWDELGRLMNLNQLMLEKIGVSCPEIDRLIATALEAGAYGAKISGSGGGGIIIALTPVDAQRAVADALGAAGGKVFTPDIGVHGTV